MDDTNFHQPYQNWKFIPVSQSLDYCNAIDNP